MIYYFSYNYGKNGDESLVDYLYKENKNRKENLKEYLKNQKIESINFSIDFSSNNAIIDITEFLKFLEKMGVTSENSPIINFSFSLPHFVLNELQKNEKFNYTIVFKKYKLDNHFKISLENLNNTSGYIERDDFVINLIIDFEDKHNNKITISKINSLDFDRLNTKTFLNLKIENVSDAHIKNEQLNEDVQLFLDFKNLSDEEIKSIFKLFEQMNTNIDYYFNYNNMTINELERIIKLSKNYLGGNDKYASTSVTFHDIDKILQKYPDEVFKVENLKYFNIFLDGDIKNDIIFSNIDKLYLIFKESNKIDKMNNIIIEKVKFLNLKVHLFMNNQMHPIFDIKNTHIFNLKINYENEYKDELNSNSYFIFDNVDIDNLVIYNNLNYFNKNFNIFLKNLFKDVVKVKKLNICFSNLSFSTKWKKTIEDKLFNLVDDDILFYKIIENLKEKINYEDFNFCDKNKKTFLKNNVKLYLSIYNKKELLKNFFLLKNIIKGED